MTLQLPSTSDPRSSYRSRRRALRAGWGRVWQITSEFTENTPLRSHADTLISLLEACGNSRLPPAMHWLPARSWALLPAPPFCVLALVARFCRASPTLCSTPPLFLSPPSFPDETILYPTDRHTGEAIFCCFVFHGQKKNTSDSKPTDNFTFKGAGELGGRRVSYIQ